MEQSLAVKWRPKCFAEVIGQNTIISILSRQVATKTFKHNYLFVGPSGCGKTTIARLVASEINNNQGSPIEIDGASNNGVDNIRNIIVDAQQMAIDSDYKIYIVDECHQLTRAAWDAALKLIEEPPSNAVFIFCTTNPNKIPDTILSRVQRFDFKKVSVNEIADRLEYILNEEEFNYNYTRDALLLIANKANGLVRESISLLEKCISYSDEINVDNVTTVLGLPKSSIVFNIFKSAITKDYISASENLDALKSSDINYINIFDFILQYFISCAKYKRLKIDTTGLLSDDCKLFIDSINNDLMEFVDRLLKYRQLSNSSLDANSLLEIAILEICRR